MSQKKDAIPPPTQEPPSTALHEVANPIRKITGVWHLKIPGEAVTSTCSPPFHLLHYIVRGEYTAIISGDRYPLTPGDVVYYQGSENVTAINRNTTPVEFFSVAFHAPELQLDVHTQRVWSNQQHRHALFEEMYLGLMSDTVRTALTLHAKLLALLAEMITAPARPESALPIPPWSKAERMLKENRLFRLGLPELSRQVGASPSTLHRSCLQCCDTSPGKRMRHLRMEEARGLLLFTKMPITAIAQELGYPRIHEFSRETKAHFGLSPSALRQASAPARE